MAKSYQIGEVVLHNWTIEKLIGEGSYGKVYQIGRDDFGTHYSAALKIISVPQSEAERRAIVEEGLTHQEVTQYFYTMVEEIVKEFSLMAQFKGTANIVSYEDHQVVEHEDGNGWDIFIRMELLTPLQSYLASRTISQDDVVHLAVDLCKALELCQKHNVIHRDIKPENVFLSPNGDFKLGDFGIARTIERTSSGLSKKGTYSYMAPEVYRGLEYGFTVDTYSLGLVLYRLLNQNRLPFMPTPPAPLTFSDREKALATRISGNPLPLPFYGQGGIAEMICKACSYDPAQRYPSATSFRMALESLGEVSKELLHTDFSPAHNSASPERSVYPSTGHFTENAYVSQPSLVPEQERHGMREIEEERTTGIFSPEPPNVPPSISPLQTMDTEIEERTTGIFSPDPLNLPPLQSMDTGRTARLAPREAPSKKSPWLLVIPLVAVVGLAVGLGFFLGKREPEQSNATSETSSAGMMEGIVVNASNGLNVRASDNLDSEVLTLLSDGTNVEILRDTGTGWYEIYVQGTEIGYVMSEYVVTNQDASAWQAANAAAWEAANATTEEEVPSWEGEIMASLEEQSANAESDGFVLETIGSEIVLVQYTGTATAVEIPANVTSIGDYAFDKGTMETVTMGNSVTSMGTGAFRDCAALKSITLSEAITVIEDATFGRCYKLESITAKNATHIGKSAFSFCNALETIYVTDALTHIGDSAFSWCHKLTDLEIPSSVEFIGREAFVACDSVHYVKIPSPNIFIEEDAFDFCANFSNVYVLENSDTEAYFQENHPDVRMEYL